MTNQTDIEALIEEAAKAAALARRGVTAKVNDTDRAVARAALAVFERANEMGKNEN